MPYTHYVGVSFARTPLEQISEKAAAIEALGWREERRVDPWVASFARDFPDRVADPEADLREVMGDYWVDADAIRELLASK